mmetsp:Transcript_10625/g.30344  ORF Transcript_10625/g.30344 Transcript_10625/m.30344 type:complete len:218 (+) Transcript_10625:1700-2353(+)
MALVRKTKRTKTSPRSNGPLTESCWRLGVTMGWPEFGVRTGRWSTLCAGTRDQSFRSNGTNAATSCCREATTRARLFGMCRVLREAYSSSSTSTRNRRWMWTGWMTPPSLLAPPIRRCTSAASACPVLSRYTRVTQTKSTRSNGIHRGRCWQVARMIAPPRYGNSKATDWSRYMTLRVISRRYTLSNGAQRVLVHRILTSNRCWQRPPLTDRCVFGM